MFVSYRLGTMRSLRRGRQEERPHIISRAPPAQVFLRTHLVDRSSICESSESEEKYVEEPRNFLIISEQFSKIPQNIINKTKKLSVRLLQLLITILGVFGSLKCKHFSQASHIVCARLHRWHRLDELTRLDIASQGSWL